MSLRKAIEHGKEHRKPYYGSKDFDRTCRNHGSCPWCVENRKHKFIVRERVMDTKLKEYYFDDVFDELDKDMIDDQLYNEWLDEHLNAKEREWC